MAQVGARHGSSRMPRARLGALVSVLLALVLTGCAVGAPPTITPAVPTVAPAQTDTSRGVPGELPPTVDGEVAGSSDTHRGRGSKEPLDDADLVTLGEELTAALESGDVAAWMALTALHGDAAQQQRDWFAGVQAVPMDVRAMHPTRVHEQDVEGVVDGPRVEFAFRHQVSGADALPSVELYDLTLERVGTDGPYRVVAVAGSQSLDAAYPQLWDLRPLEVVETEHTVLIGEAGSEVEALADALDEAAAAVFELFPVDGVERMSITVVDPSLTATVLGESEEGVYAGFAVPVPLSSSVDTGGTLPEVVVDDTVGARLVIDQEYAQEEWAVYGEPDGGLPTMRHEGLHLAMLLLHPDPLPPRWAIEGFAGWVELLGDPGVREAHLDWYVSVLDGQGLPTSLPPASMFGFHDSETTVLERHYAESANVFLYAEERYGREETLELGEALHQHDVFVDGDDGLDALLRERVGVDLAGFEAGYLQWAADTFGS